MRFVKELPEDLQRHIMLLMYKRMSIDDRRRCGIVPQGLVIPDHVIKKLCARPRVCYFMTSSSVFLSSAGWFCNDTYGKYFAYYGSDGVVNKYFFE